VEEDGSSIGDARDRPATGRASANLRHC
jgi:hypothetical protein